MCGIFGIAVAGRFHLEPHEAGDAARALFQLSESRGKEASGLALDGDAEIVTLKRPYTASRMMRTAEYRRLMRDFRSRLARSANGGPAGAGRAALIGHSRLVTDGVRDTHGNNQPVAAGGMVGVHNGIVVNAEELWRRHPELERQFEVDSEIIFALLRRHLEEGGELAAAVSRTYDELKGTAAIAALFSDLDQLLLATNNGSLYLRPSRCGGALFFASERYFLERLARRHRLREHLAGTEIKAVEPGTGRLVDLTDLTLQEFELDAGGGRLATAGVARGRRIRDLGPAGNGVAPMVMARTGDAAVAEAYRRHPFDRYPIEGLERCSRCILPATIPFIEFDHDGVCNFCRGYRKLSFLGEDVLMELADRHRSADGRPDCIVGVSGGRDSTYGLHYVKNVLQLNPVAYTYDWGMVTDLARRNIARICGKLGVEHLLVSADIPKKRRFIKKNVEAWLDRPHLGLIPLFMAGDKAYFYNAYRLRKNMGIDLVILCENMLERDFFKACFAGAPPEMTSEDHIGHLSWRGNLKMILFYLRHYLTNPKFLNASIPDTVFAYLCYFVIPRDYYNLFRFIPWDERTVVGTLIDEYEWEVATDTTQTWRIGDGTSAFYNFIYYNVAGFSENDNFYSNQIREGTITREQAMANVAEMNKPRFESIKWYCDTIGIDFTSTVARVSAIPKLYDRES